MLPFTENQNKKTKPNEDELSFGKIFTDHMFKMNYDEGKGWHSAEIVPYGPIQLEPSSACLHYGQEVFEGLKAYRTNSGEINLFRPIKNFERLNDSNKRMCIPTIDIDFVMDSLKQLLKIDIDWIPKKEGASLYIRPFVIAVDPMLGVHASSSYIFMIILSPVGTYYPEGLNPINVYVENKYARTVMGGVGQSKTGGNYAASLKAQDEAEQKGYSQSLWLDGAERKYVEEVGAMNIFFVINGEVVTPALVGSFLAGITRMSVIELLKDMGVKVSERLITIEEIFEAIKKGHLTEVFGTGTAAVVSPIGRLGWNQKAFDINNNKIGDITQKLYNTLTDIQWGHTPDKYNWITKLD